MVQFNVALIMIIVVFIQDMWIIINLLYNALLEEYGSFQSIIFLRIVSE